jgi:hypothetical protein
MKLIFVAESVVAGIMGLALALFRTVTTQLLFGSSVILPNRTDSRSCHWCNFARSGS